MYNVPDFDESYDRRINEEETEQNWLDDFLDSLDGDPMEAYKQMVERTED